MVKSYPSNDPHSVPPPPPDYITHIKVTHSFGACCDVSSQHASCLDCLAGPDVRAADHAVSCDWIVQRAHVINIVTKLIVILSVNVNREYLLHNHQGEFL